MMLDKIKKWAKETEKYFSETVQCPRCEKKMERGKAASIQGYGPLCPTCLRREGEKALSAFLMEPTEDASTQDLPDGPKT